MSSASRDLDAALDDLPEREPLRLPIEWRPSGSTGTVTIVVDLPDGKFTDTLKVTSAKARAAFHEQVRQRLSDDENDDLRAQLEEIAEQAAEEPNVGSGGGRLVDRLVQRVLELDTVELFQVEGQLDDGYATVPQGGQSDTCRIGSRSFERWLTKLCFDEFSEVPTTSAVAEASTVLTAHALHGPCERKLFIRVGSVTDGIAIDLHNAAREVVVVSDRGWRVASNMDVDVRFLRRDGALPLPTPIRGGRVDDLRPLVNVGCDDQWVLLCLVMQSFLFPAGPYPVLAVSGEHGSAKSTLSKMVQRLVDPNRAGIRRPPKSERDLLIAARNGWLQAYDNLSGLSPDLSDALCSLATGGGFGARRLYTDDDELIFEAQRPILLNGIDDFDDRADLLDRMVVLQLPRIDDLTRRAESDLWAAFDSVAPGVFGALLDGLVAVVRGREHVVLERLPRMADFARTATAAEVALGFTSGSFASAFERNRELARRMAIEQDPFAIALLRVTEKHELWCGTASALLQATQRLADVGAQRHPTWPRTPAGVGRRIRRIAEPLRRVGVTIKWGEKGPGRNRDRVIRIWADSSDGTDSQARPPESALAGPQSLIADGTDGSDGLSREAAAAGEQAIESGVDEARPRQAPSDNRPKRPNRPHVPMPRAPALFRDQNGGEA